MLDIEKILFITTTAVKGFSVRGGEVKELASLPWTPENIGRVLGTMRSALGRSVRVLVGEPFTYVATLSLPEKEAYASSKEERKTVLRAAGKLIPEDMEHMIWDYRRVPFSSSEGRCVQVVALVASFARVVASAVKDAGFRVSLTLPESCALASLFADRKEPFLLVSRGDGFFVAGVSGGVVLSSVTSLESVTLESVENTKRFLENHFALSPKNIVFVGSFSEGDLGNFDRDRAERAGFSIEFSKRNAVEALAEEKNAEGDDGLTLSVELMFAEKDISSPDAEKQSEEVGGVRERFHSHALDERTSAERSEENVSSKRFVKFSRRTLLLAYAFLAVFLLGTGVIFLLKWYD